jgi:glycosyltransferase involved in cell wall biosynthesis
MIGFIIKKFYFPKIKLIFHEHGMIFGSEKGNPLEDLFVKLFLKLTKKNVDLVIAVSKATKNELFKKAKISADKIEILYNFVDLDKFNRKNITWDIKQEKEKLGIKKNECVIGFAGRILERKGWREFVESVKKFRNIKFIIAGDGEEKALLIKQIKGFNNIIYLGYYCEMVKFYSYFYLVLS